MSEAIYSQAVLIYSIVLVETSNNEKLLATIEAGCPAPTDIWKNQEVGHNFSLNVP